MWHCKDFPLDARLAKWGLEFTAYVSRLPAQREQQPLNGVLSLLPPSHQNPNQNTPGKSIFTLYFLSLGQHEENTKQNAHLYSSLLGISSRARTAKIRSHTWVALYMPHPSPETPVSLSISQSMALKWATQIEGRWKKQQILLCSFKESMALYLILRARQRREHSRYLCNSLIRAPRKSLRFSAMLILGRLKYLSPSLWKSI